MSDTAQPEKLAWMRLVLQTYEGPLTRYAARITGDMEAARDVVQDAFVRLCDQDPALMNGRLPQWLYTVCRNRALDVLRREGRMQALGEVEVEAGESGNHDPARIAEERDGTSRVLVLLARLPANQQEVVRLRFQNGLSYKEIATVTGLSVTNVGFLIHVAIKVLRQELDA